MSLQNIINEEKKAAKAKAKASIEKLKQRIQSLEALEWTEERWRELSILRAKYKAQSKTTAIEAVVVHEHK